MGRVEDRVVHGDADRAVGVRGRGLPLAGGGRTSRYVGAGTGVSDVGASAEGRSGWVVPACGSLRPGRGADGRLVAAPPGEMERAFQGALADVLVRTESGHRDAWDVEGRQAADGDQACHQLVVVVGSPQAQAAEGDLLVRSWRLVDRHDEAVAGTVRSYAALVVPQVLSQQWRLQ